MPLIDIIISTFSLTTMTNGKAKGTLWQIKYNKRGETQNYSCNKLKLQLSNQALESLLEWQWEFSIWKTRTQKLLKSKFGLPKT